MILLEFLDQLPIAYGALLAGGLGAILGSFIATLALRWPKGEGLGGRSHCDACGRTLRAAELVPLLSRLWLRGKCRDCGAAIEPFHGRVEATAAGIGAAAVFVMPGLVGWIWALMGWMLLPLMLLDARHFWLPDRLVMPLAVMGLLMAGPLTGASLDQRFIGAVVGGLTLLAVMSAYRKLRGVDGMGGGDPKLMAALGAWLGWQALPLALLLASAAGIIWALLSHKKEDGALAERAIPFGVFLGAGGWLSAALWPLMLR
jgi:leader peptidase (prepilin peptidase)/N-methyltransferase